MTHSRHSARRMRSGIRFALATLAVGSAFQAGACTSSPLYLLAIVRGIYRPALSAGVAGPHTDAGPGGGISQDPLGTGTQSTGGIAPNNFGAGGGV